jgi:hypothetical protein
MPNHTSAPGQPDGKDRLLPVESPPVPDGNVLWGQGQTPIKEVLQLMRQEKWTFPAEVELEYQTPKVPTR